MFADSPGAILSLIHIGIEKYFMKEFYVSIREEM